MVSIAGCSKMNNPIRTPPSPIIASPGNQLDLALFIERHVHFLVNTYYNRRGGLGRLLIALAEVSSLGVEIG